MPPLQKIQLRQSEKRQKLNALLELDELTEEQRGQRDTLTTELQDLEPELRAAIVGPARLPSSALPDTRRAWTRRRGSGRNCARSTP